MKYRMVQTAAATNAAKPCDESEAKKFKSAVMFSQIAQGLKQDGSNVVKKVGAVYCFKVHKGPGGQSAVWIVDAKNDSGQVVYNGNVKPDCTIMMSDDDLLKLSMGKLNPQQAFFQGKLKISGNIGLAMKLREFMGQDATKSKL